MQLCILNWVFLNINKPRIYFFSLTLWKNSNFFFHFISADFFSVFILIHEIFAIPPLHYFTSKVGKTEKLTLTEKIFREINSLLKTLLSRNLCQKYAWRKFCTFHSSTLWNTDYTYGKYSMIKNDIWIAYRFLTLMPFYTVIPYVKSS